MTHPLIEAYRLAVLHGRTTEPDIAAYEIAEADLARALTRTPDAVRALREAYLVASCATPHQWTPEGMRMHIVIGIRKLIEAAEAAPVTRTPDAVQEAAEEVWRAVQQTHDHTQWFEPLAKLGMVLASAPQAQDTKS